LLSNEDKLLLFLTSIFKKKCQNRLSISNSVQFLHFGIFGRK